MKAVLTDTAQLHSAGRRLDASYHASAGVQALRLVRQWARVSELVVAEPPGVLHEAQAGVSTMRRLDLLADVCVADGIFTPGRFRRTYVDDPNYGERWLSPSDMLRAELADLRLISRKGTPQIESLRIHKGWILLSRSGTIGNVAYVRQDMEGLVGSDDVIRIVADASRIPSGYLYAFLCSSYGKALIEQKTYGAVVPHIEAHHVTSLPVPRTKPGIEQRIHDLIERAAALRVQALESRQEALRLASSVLNVDLSVFEPMTLLTILPKRLNWRLEAAYHAARQAVESTFAASHVNRVPIGDLLLDMFYLGKLHRVFVESPHHGVPLLSIADVRKAKLRSDKFVSKTQSRNVNQALLQKNWILVSRTGTPGLVTYVRREMVGMAGTDHLVRLVPDGSKVLPGYLYVVLDSPVGRGLLLGSVHGSVQLQLPPEYIARIEIPLPSIADQQPVHDLIDRYAEVLTQASESEDRAQALLGEALELEVV